MAIFNSFLYVYQAGYLYKAAWIWVSMVSGLRCTDLRIYQRFKMLK